MDGFAYQFFIPQVMIQMAMSLQVNAGCLSIQYVIIAYYYCLLYAFLFMEFWRQIWNFHSEIYRFNASILAKFEA